MCIENKFNNIVNNMKNQDDADWLRCMFKRMQDAEADLIEIFKDEEE